MTLSVQNLCVGYKPEKVVFENINFELQCGHFAVLLGVNGIGKSTLIRTLCGLQPKVSGSITFSGKSIDTFSVTEMANTFSYVSTEKISLENMSVYDFISLGRFPHTNWLGRLSATDKEKIDEVLELLSFQNFINKPFNYLSDGERQHAIIGRALCQDTPVIILDEPTAFLDFKNKEKVFGLLKRIAHDFNKLIILSTHDLSAASRFSSQLLMMKETKSFIQLTEKCLTEEQLKEFLIAV